MKYDRAKHDVSKVCDSPARGTLVLCGGNVVEYDPSAHCGFGWPIIVPRQQYLVPGTFAWAFVEMEHHRCDRYTWGAGTLEYYITRDGLLRTVDSEWPCKWELIDIFVPLMYATDWRPVETQAKEPAPQLTLDIRALREKLAEINAIVGGQV